MQQEQVALPPPVTAQVSARDARKLELSAQRNAEAEAKALDKRLRQALREASPERSADSRQLIASHPAESERLRASMAKTEARKEQELANAAETEEDDATLTAKVAELAQMVREAQHAVIYTGAGLSTAAAIPDYRGPQGLWTLAQKKKPGSAKADSGSRNAPCAARQAMGQSFAESRPTSGHMAIAALVGKGHVKHVISQNVDGLHMRSGLKPHSLCELHGNVFRERCPSCGKEYLRPFDVTGKSAYHRHGTERTCEAKGCAEASLRDTIVYFGEKVHADDLSAAQENAESSDLGIFLGSSLKVLTHYAFIWRPLPKPRKKRIVIVNLQPTPRDKQADLRIFGKCDDVLQRLLEALKLPTPSYEPTDDVVHQLALKMPTPPTPQQPQPPLLQRQQPQPPQP